MTEIRNILLIGRTGSGKSTLANIISKFGKFQENSGSVSATKKVEEGMFIVNGAKYRVIDTVGLGDTELTRIELLKKLKEETDKYVSEGVYQILFVASGRITKDEVIDFKWLSSHLFDGKVFNYTTIVRTGFSGFLDEKECKKDIKNLVESSIDEDFEKLILEGKIVYVNNPDKETAGEERFKELRQASRSKLLDHFNFINSQQLNIYRPAKPAWIKARFDSLKEKISSATSMVSEKAKSWWYGKNSQGKKELIELEKELRDGNWVNRDLLKENMELQKLINGCREIFFKECREEGDENKKARLKKKYEENKETLDELLTMQIKITRAKMDKKDSKDLDQSLDALKDELEDNKLPKNEIKTLLRKQAEVTKLKVLCGELELSDKFQLQLDIHNGLSIAEKIEELEEMKKDYRGSIGSLNDLLKCQEDLGEKSDKFKEMNKKLRGKTGFNKLDGILEKNREIIELKEGLINSQTQIQIPPK